MYKVIIAVVLIAIWMMGSVVRAAEQRAGQSEWERVLASAKKEGAVTVAGAPGDTHREALADAFAKAYPEIRIEYTGMSGRDGVPRIVRERQANLFAWDIYIGGPTSALGGLKPIGAFDPLRPALLRPEILDDSKWHGGFQDGFMDTEGRLFYAFDGTVTQSVFVNREFISKSEIHSSKDLLDPKWAGKIVWEDPRFEGAGLNASLVFYLAYGEDFLRRLLREQKIVYTRDRRQMTEWVVRGRYPVAIALATDELIIFQEKGVGKQIEPAGPDPVNSMIPGFGSTALINRAPHPNAARVYLNWLLSPDGQRVWAQATKRNSRRLDVPPGDPGRVTGKEKYVNTQKESVTPQREKVMKIAREVLP